MELLPGKFVKDSEYVKTGNIFKKIKLLITLNKPKKSTISPFFSQFQNVHVLILMKLCSCIS